MQQEPPVWTLTGHVGVMYTSNIPALFYYFFSCFLVKWRHVVNSEWQCTRVYLKQTSSYNVLIDKKAKCSQ